MTGPAVASSRSCLRRNPWVRLHNIAVAPNLGFGSCRTTSALRFGELASRNRGWVRLPLSPERFRDPGKRSIRSDCSHPYAKEEMQYPDRKPIAGEKWWNNGCGNSEKCAKRPEYNLSSCLGAHRPRNCINHNPSDNRSAQKDRGPWDCKDVEILQQINPRRPRKELRRQREDHEADDSSYCLDLIRLTLARRIASLRAQPAVTLSGRFIFVSGF